VPPSLHSNNAAAAAAPAGLSVGRAAGWPASLRAHSVTAVPQGSARFWSTGGSRSASQSPDLSQVGVRAGSVLVLAPGGGNSSSIYSQGAAGYGARLQQDALLLQQQAQRGQSVSIGSMQRQSQQQQQQQQAVCSSRVPGSHATVSRTGSVISAAGSSSGRCIATGLQLQPHEQCGGYSSSNASRSSSPAELSASLDLRRRSLVAARAASLEGRRPGSPLGQSFSSAGNAGLGSATNVTSITNGLLGAASAGLGSPREVTVAVPAGHAVCDAASVGAGTAAVGSAAGLISSVGGVADAREEVAAAAAEVAPVAAASAGVGEVAPQ
jgi:hypothetical protein